MTTSPPFSVHGIHRRKHTLRAIFRSASLFILVTIYLVYNHYIADDLENEIRISRNLNLAHVQSTTTGQCPALETASAPEAVGLFAGILYMFLALAIVCDEFFVPALEEIASPHHMNLSMDVAGATLMAAGGSAPELFTSFVGTFQESDIGIGTIVGSAVFNVLFVIGVCSMLSREVLHLTWWPLFRDCSYYAVGLGVLSVMVGVSTSGMVDWWEALVLFVMYVGYVIVMKYNRALYKKLTGKELVSGDDSSDAFEENARDNGDGTALDAEHHNASPHSPEGDIIRTATSHADFRWPGTFRAGVLKLLLHPSSWEDRGGIGIVAKIQGDVEQVFRMVDLNGDGGIDLEELGKLFVKLGHEISREDLTEVFKSLDLDGNGTVSHWN